jgi:hypothetical protein
VSLVSGGVWNASSMADPANANAAASTRRRKRVLPLQPRAEAKRLRTQEDHLTTGHSHKTESYKVNLVLKLAKVTSDRTVFRWETKKPVWLTTNIQIRQDLLIRQYQQIQKTQHLQHPNRPLITKVSLQHPGQHGHILIFHTQSCLRLPDINETPRTA